MTVRGIGVRDIYLTCNQIRNYNVSLLQKHHDTGKNLRRRQSSTVQGKVYASPSPCNEKDGGFVFKELQFA